uniref:Uncharacterized protein n=1 Tax=Chromera velia CCMP2878 TaxID=1169474 RepID=A0A0G4G7L5_9ALVE|eukprot:Cvel_4291.t1-p1 / transcript=Cvel_4291.t1 / gene=Cvel_4291 / organism=Chromera_velia_CCMP2878 / gene_product=hypothetical protein / transcript_product=hypothetical protein / location=Cvel_scaffold186:49735-53066(-) / protein_length=762 / sequence_SO=supercontig / SO=protein_coding / is_pseudo=false
MNHTMDADEDVGVVEAQASWDSEDCLPLRNVFAFCGLTTNFAILSSVCKDFERVYAEESRGSRVTSVANVCSDWSVFQRAGGMKSILSGLKGVNLQEEIFWEMPPFEGRGMSLPLDYQPKAYVSYWVGRLGSPDLLKEVEDLVLQGPHRGSSNDREQRGFHSSVMAFLDDFSRDSKDEGASGGGGGCYEETLINARAVESLYFFLSVFGRLSGFISEGLSAQVVEEPSPEPVDDPEPDSPPLETGEGGQRESIGRPSAASRRLCACLCVLMQMMKRRDTLRTFALWRYIRGVKRRQQQAEGDQSRGQTEEERGVTGGEEKGQVDGNGEEIHPSGVCVPVEVREDEEGGDLGKEKQLKSMGEQGRAASCSTKIGSARSSLASSTGVGGGVPSPSAQMAAATAIAADKEAWGDTSKATTLACAKAFVYGMAEAGRVVELESFHERARKAEIFPFTEIRIFILCGACRGGQTPVISWLRGPGRWPSLHFDHWMNDVDSSFYDEFSPEQLIARHGHAELLDFLMGELSIESWDSMWETEISNEAARQGHVRVMEVLEKRGGFPVKYHKDIIFRGAARRGDVAAVRQMLAETLHVEMSRLKESIAKLHEEDREGVEAEEAEEASAAHLGAGLLSELDVETACYAAAENGQLEVLKTITSVVPEDEWNPTETVYAAEECGHEEVAAWLREQEACARDMEERRKELAELNRKELAAEWRFHAVPHRRGREEDETEVVAAAAAEAGARAAAAASPLPRETTLRGGGGRGG